MDNTIKEKFISLKEQGLSLAKISHEMGISRSQAHRIKIKLFPNDKRNQGKKITKISFPEDPVNPPKKNVLIMDVSEVDINKKNERIQNLERENKILKDTIKNLFLIFNNN